MKKFIFIFVAASSLLACSKNKDQVNDPGGNVDLSARIKTIAGSSSVTTYTYDAKKRIQTETNASGSGYRYEYNGNTVKLESINNAGVVTMTRFYDLDAAGRCTRISDPTKPGKDEHLFYDSEGHEIKQTYFSGGGANLSSIDYFYSNGNCDSIRVSTNGTWAYTSLRTYYTDKPNTLSLETTGEAFFGKVEKNLLKTNQTLYPDGSKGTLEELSYEFDSSGRVVKRTSKSGANLGISLFDYY